MPDLAAIQAANSAKQALIDQLGRIETCEWPRLASAFVRSLGVQHTPDPAVVLTLFIDLITQISRLPGGRALPHPAELVQSIETRHARSRPSDQELLENLAEDLGRWLSKVESPTRAAEISAFIDAHFSERLTLNTLARTFGMSQRRLSEMYKRHAGLTVHQYIVRQRIRHARELVRCGEKVEVAMLDVGYRNKTHFYRAFETYTGSRPGLYAPKSTRPPGGDRAADSHTAHTGLPTRQK